MGNIVSEFFKKPKTPEFYTTDFNKTMDEIAGVTTGRNRTNAGVAVDDYLTGYGVTMNQLFSSEFKDLAGADFFASEMGTYLTGGQIMEDGYSGAASNALNSTIGKFNFGGGIQSANRLTEQARMEKSLTGVTAVGRVNNMRTHRIQNFFQPGQRALDTMMNMNTLDPETAVMGAVNASHMNARATFAVDTTRALARSPFQAVVYSAIGSAVGTVAGAFGGAIGGFLTGGPPGAMKGAASGAMSGQKIGKEAGESPGFTPSPYSGVGGGQTYSPSSGF